MACGHRACLERLVRRVGVVASSMLRSTTTTGLPVSEAQPARRMRALAFVEKHNDHWTTYTSQRLTTGTSPVVTVLLNTQHSQKLRPCFAVLLRIIPVSRNLRRRVATFDEGIRPQWHVRRTCLAFRQRFPAPLFSCGEDEGEEERAKLFFFRGARPAKQEHRTAKGLAWELSSLLNFTHAYVTHNTRPWHRRQSRVPL